MRDKCVVTADKREKTPQSILLAALLGVLQNTASVQGEEVNHSQVQDRVSKAVQGGTALQLPAPQPLPDNAGKGRTERGGQEKLLFPSSLHCNENQWIFYWSWKSLKG